MAASLVTIGDSVHWGQGLHRAHKLHTIVASALRITRPDLEHHFLAHSGAIIGVGATVRRQRVDGEVPIAYPTILEQVDGVGGNPADAVAVLVNGGINDVDIRNILNPVVPPETLSDLIVEHCCDSMRVLLDAVVHRFDNPATAIVVTPYYPVLSTKSKPLGIPRLLANEGLAVRRRHASAAGRGRARAPGRVRCRLPAGGLARARAVLPRLGGTSKRRGRAPVRRRDSRRAPAIGRVRPDAAV